MKELYQIASEYYINLESFSAYGGFKEPYTWGFLLGFLMFSLCFVMFVFTVSIEKWPLNWWFLSTIVVELVTIQFFDRLTKKRNAVFIAYLSRKTNEFISLDADLDELKTRFLESLLNCASTEFYEVSQKLNAMMSMERETTGKRGMIDSIFSFIYVESANQRILALFIVLSSIITILAVNSGQNIEGVFDLLSSKGFWAAYGAYLVVSVVSYWMIRLSYNFLKRVMVFVSLLFYKDKTKIQNLSVIKYLMADLNYYSTFERDEETKNIIILPK